MKKKNSPMEAVANQVKANKKHLLEGRVLSIDPGSVRFGWAYYEAGILVASGQEHIKGRWPHHRLRILGSIVSGLPPADLLITEKIGKWNSKTVASSYITLLKSIGVIVANTSWKYCMEISPSIWQSLNERWSKSTDENDAITIGEVTIALATEGPPSEEEEEEPDVHREKSKKVQTLDPGGVDALH